MIRHVRHWLLVCLALTLPCAAQNLDTPRFEAGVAVGEPTGGIFKAWLTERNAVAAFAGVAFVPDAVAQLYADFLRHDFRFTEDLTAGELPIVYGLGVTGLFTDDFTLGIRIPLGLTYLFSDIPFTLFLHVAPRFDVIPEFDVGLNASLGIRYVF